MGETPQDQQKRHGPDVDITRRSFVKKLAVAAAAIGLGTAIAVTIDTALIEKGIMNPSSPKPETPTQMSIAEKEERRKEIDTILGMVQDNYLNEKLYSEIEQFMNGLLDKPKAEYDKIVKKENYKRDFSSDFVSGAQYAVAVDTSSEIKYFVVEKFIKNEGTEADRLNIHLAIDESRKADPEYLKTVFNQTFTDIPTMEINGTEKKGLSWSVSHSLLTRFGETIISGSGNHDNSSGKDYYNGSVTSLGVVDHNTERHPQ